MPDVFFSYSIKDEDLARKLKVVLDSLGVNTFLASVSLPPGKQWKEEILKNLRESKWVFFLATKNSCDSRAVMHEIGGALILQKELIPLMWGVSTDELPEWIQDRQAIDLQSPTDEKAREAIEQVVEKVKADRFIGSLVLGALGVLLIYALMKD